MWPISFGCGEERSSEPAGGAGFDCAWLGLNVCSETNGDSSNKAFDSFTQKQRRSCLVKRSPLTEEGSSSGSRSVCIPRRHSEFATVEHSFSSKGSPERANRRAADVKASSSAPPPSRPLSSPGVLQEIVGSPESKERGSTVLSDTSVVSLSPTQTEGPGHRADSKLSDALGQMALRASDPRSSHRRASDVTVPVSSQQGMRAAHFSASLQLPRRGSGTTADGKEYVVGNAEDSTRTFFIASKPRLQHTVSEGAYLQDFTQLSSPGSARSSLDMTTLSPEILAERSVSSGSATSGTSNASVDSARDGNLSGRSTMRSEALFDEESEVIIPWERKALPSPNNRGSNGKVVVKKKQVQKWMSMPAIPLPETPGVLPARARYLPESEIEGGTPRYVL